MRDFKFRAWRDSGFSESKMLHPHSITLAPDNSYIGACSETETIGVNHNLKERDEFHLMQFTGCLDKNDTEMYEGDLVRVVRYDGEFDQVHPVIFERGAFRLDGLNILGTNLVGQIGASCLEVVGNIYETPELAKAM